ncbi:MULTISPECIES: pilus assembly protein N-terminal domain-containing protein [unclassified Bradyrhizobium]|uniref:pilus assembly protein N-terminal domain-containing protein n=1 Tax=unclassified Bradyrhizobium TaxID=2631580 RepID=UPI001CD25265|nr:MULTISPECIES: pilus assembly protein N-terminal domain-containing protein [unclassified Bradyrhizobium]MCA1378787.1 pilus assembly protein N-terminal domain-containing protein [Bradyrhizobium sp. IC4060]
MLFSGFWRCCVIATLTLLADGAFAQPPQEISVPAEDTIRLQPGQIRILQFGEAVKQIGTPEDNIVEITPQSERIFTFRGLASGETIVTARSDDGRVVHRVRVVVGGNLVKVYGLADEPDYVGFICDGYGCGRGESGQAKANSTAVRKPLRGGGFIEKNYQ